MQNPRDIIRVILDAVQGAKHSIERSRGNKNPDGSYDHDTLRAMLRIEEIKLHAQSRYRYNNVVRNPEGALRNLVQDIQPALKSIIDDNSLKPILLQSRFRAPIGVRDRYIEEFLPSDVSREDLNVWNILEHLHIYIGKLPIQESFLEFEEITASAQRLKNILPAQKIAPIQFDFSGNKIVVSDQKAYPSEDNFKNVSDSLEHLLKNGRSIIDELKSSNCDRRLLDNVTELQNNLEENNIIKLGLSNISCGLMRETYKEELPDAVNTMIQAHVIGIDMYTAQFSDWNRFVENAVSVSIDKDEAAYIKKANSDVMRSIDSQKDIFDDRVYTEFEKLDEALSPQSPLYKRASFAVIRSLGNLITKVFSLGIDFVSQTANQTVKGLSNVASKVIIVSILTFGLQSAEALAPIAGKVNEMSWLRDAIDIVKNQLKHIKSEKS